MEAGSVSNNRVELEITVVSGSGPRCDSWLTLCFFNDNVFFGGEWNTCGFWNWMLLLNHKQLSLLCACVFVRVQLEMGLAFSFKLSASRQTTRSHPDKRHRLISSQPLWKVSLHLQPVQERCCVNNMHQGHGDITQPPNGVSQSWSANAVENRLLNVVEPQTVPHPYLAALPVQNTCCTPGLWNHEVIKLL